MKRIKNRQLQLTTTLTIVMRESNTLHRMVTQVVSWQLLCLSSNHYYFYRLEYQGYSIFIYLSSLDFSNPSTYTLPKTECRELSNDEINGYQGIAVKSEFDNISPDIFNEIIPVFESDIPGYAKDIIQERRLQALGKNFYHVTIFRPGANITYLFHFIGVSFSDF